MPSKKPPSDKNRLRFGRNVAALRKAIGLTQEKAAERVGVSTRYFQDIESGTYFPSLALLIRLQKLLDSDWNALFNGCGTGDRIQ